MVTTVSFVSGNYRKVFCSRRSPCRKNVGCSRKYPCLDIGFNSVPVISEVPVNKTYTLVCSGSSCCMLTARCSRGRPCGKILRDLDFDAYKTLTDYGKERCNS